MNLVKVPQEEIIKILSDHYNLKPSQVTLHTDYHFVKRNGDKVREDFVYAIIDKSEETANISESNDEFNIRGFIKELDICIKQDGHDIYLKADSAKKVKNWLQSLIYLCYRHE